jgi:hypothetical protein
LCSRCENRKIKENNLDEADYQEQIEALDQAAEE